MSPERSSRGLSFTYHMILDMSVAQHTGTVTGLKSFKQTKRPTTASGRPGTCKFKDPLTDPLVVAEQNLLTLIQFSFLTCYFFMISNTSGDIIRPHPWYCD